MRESKESKKQRLEYYYDLRKNRASVPEIFYINKLIRHLEKEIEEME